MRTWGRINGSAVWQEITTDLNGFNDEVYVVTLAQVCLLNLGESPFYANYGIPAHQSIMQQVFPDYYISYTQQQFAQYFASLTIARQPGSAPVYQINVTTNQGAKINASVPIPQ